MASHQRRSRAIHDSFILVDHPLVKRDLTILRDRRTSNAEFRSVIHRVAFLMAVESTRDLHLHRTKIHTPLEPTAGYILEDQVVIVPILRAGLGLLEGFLELLPEARVGHVGLYRNEETLQPVDYYAKFPRKLDQSLVLLLDPMLATGGSGAAAITFLKKRGARRIRLVTLLAAPEGVRRVLSLHPDVLLYTGALDRKLNEYGYILPGLGDAGDRIFGTE